jgi:hypothetical protein
MGICKVDPDKWNNGFYYDVKLENAFPLEVDTFYPFEESGNYFKVKVHDVDWFVPKIFLIDVSEYRKNLILDFIDSESC